MTEIVQESEMAAIRQIFERAANAIVQASELSVKVNELSDKVNHLVQDIEQAQAKNRDLDEALSNVRHQRDNALNELADVKDKLHTQESYVASLTQSNEAQAKSITALHESLDKAKDEARGWEQAALKADQELQEAKAMLDKLQSIFGQGLAASKPKPEPEPTRAEPSYAQAQPTPVEDHGGVTDTEPKPIVTQRDPGFDWNKPYHYSFDLGTNVQD